jgi:hypothetical protein
VDAVVISPSRNELRVYVNEFKGQLNDKAVGMAPALLTGPLTSPGVWQTVACISSLLLYSNP